MRLAIKHGEDLLGLSPVSYKTLQKSVGEFFGNSSRLYFRHDAEAFSVSAERMEHFLGRHHPTYWQGSPKALNTALDGSLSVDDVYKLVERTVNEGYSSRSMSAPGVFEYTAELDSSGYKAVTAQGQVVQFHPCAMAQCVP